MSQAAAPATYLARDYESFRGLLLAHLEAERSGTSTLPVASLEVLLVEAMAYMGDYLAYYQDAVGTEAYVGTARQRRSLARHGVLLGKTINEGCCARTLVRLKTHDSHVSVPKGTQLLTQLPGLETLHIDDLPEHHDVAFFSTLHGIIARKQHANMPLAKDQPAFFTSGDSAILQGSYPDLGAGDFLILQAKNSGWPHPVRLVSSVVEGEKTKVSWLADDALSTDATKADDWLAWGNLVLVEEGQRIELGAPLDFDGSAPDAILRAPMPAFAERFDPLSTDKSAARLLSPHPLLAEPDMVLEEKWSADGPSDPSSIWVASRQVLESGAASRTFVPEFINDAYLTLRFGQSNVAQESGVPLYPSYRKSHGSRGNIAAYSLAHLISSDKRIYAATNPLPATGGRDPDTLQESRASLLANCEKRGLMRCVSEADYESFAGSFPWVSDAQAVTAPNKGMRNVSVKVAPMAGAGLSDDMLAQLRDALNARAVLSDIVEVTSAKITSPYLSVRVVAQRGADGAVLRRKIAKQLEALAPSMGASVKPADVLKALGALEGLSHSELLHLDLSQASHAAGVEGKVGEVVPSPDSSIRFDLSHVSIDVVGAV